MGHLFCHQTCNVFLHLFRYDMCSVALSLTCLRTFVLMRVLVKTGKRTVHASPEDQRREGEDEAEEGGGWRADGGGNQGSRPPSRAQIASLKNLEYLSPVAIDLFTYFTYSNSFWWPTLQKSASINKQEQKHSDIVCFCLHRPLAWNVPRPGPLQLRRRCQNLLFNFAPCCVF